MAETQGGSVSAARRARSPVRSLAAHAAKKEWQGIMATTTPDGFDRETLSRPEIFAVNHKLA